MPLGHPLFHWCHSQTQSTAGWGCWIWSKETVKVEKKHVCLCNIFTLYTQVHVHAWQSIYLDHKLQAIQEKDVTISATGEQLNKARECLIAIKQASMHDPYPWIDT